MAIFKTAYDTTACKDYVMARIMDALKVAEIHGNLTPDEKNPNVLVLRGSRDSALDAVPAFAHPLFIELNRQANIVVDVRGFVKFDTNQYDYVVRNALEYGLAIQRANLNHLWLNDAPSLLRNASPLPMAVFASWISEAIGKRFALDPREQFMLAILAAVFYNSLFSDATDLEESDKLRLVNAISRALRASAQDVLTIVDQFPVVPNAAAFCQYAEAASGSIRLKEFSVGLLFAIMGGTWFGTNAKEMVAVALEHPPTWMAILAHALIERSYKNSPITKITERSGYRDLGKDYIRIILNLTTHSSHA